MPIPGTRKLERLEENIAAADIEFTTEELADIETAASTIAIEGARRPGNLQQLLKERTGG